MIEQQEMAGGNERFVPNDLYLNSTTHTVLVLTGPNMGGKSTYLRQAALVVILAQMGSFVPAASARLGVVDRVFTRIGASDNLARGRSTFMVEMTETAAILHTATPRSLILLDEVGRGTATYDGLAIAWAAVEYIHARTRAKTLFATHYFELTELAERLSGVKNYHVSVKETAGGIVFLRKVEPGAADRSYGIEVAKLAGLPNEVIERAREVLAEHESAEQRVTEQLASDELQPRQPAQLTIFTPLSQPVLEKLREVDLNRLTPLEGAEFVGGIEKAGGLRENNINFRTHRPTAYCRLRRHRNVVATPFPAYPTATCGRDSLCPQHHQRGTNSQTARRMPGMRFHSVCLPASTWKAAEWIAFAMSPVPRLPRPMSSPPAIAKPFANTAGSSANPAGPWVSTQTLRRL